MWFIGVEVEQETSAPPPKKILDPPLFATPFAAFTAHFCRPSKEKKTSGIQGITCVCFTSLYFKFKMTDEDEPRGSNSCLRKSLTFSRRKFYKANYAIKRWDVLQTEGMACAVYLDGQQKNKTKDSVLLLTWKGCIDETNDNLVMYRFSREHFREYDLNPSRLFHEENFSLIECKCSDDSKQSKVPWKLVRLKIKCLKTTEQMKNFLVYTTNGVECLDLKLKYDKQTRNHDVIHENQFDLKLCGAPIIAEQKYFVGVLRKDQDHANKFIPCFISQGELGE